MLISALDEEMSETVKTLQRALDRMDPQLAGTPAAVTHEQFIKSGLDMCIRRSNESVATVDGVPDCKTRRARQSHLSASLTSPSHVSLAAHRDDHRSRDRTW